MRTIAAGRHGNLLGDEMKVKEYQEQMAVTLKNLNRQDMWDKCFLVAIQGLLSNAPSTPQVQAGMAAQYADAMVLEWEKRR